MSEKLASAEIDESRERFEKEYILKKPDIFKDVSIVNWNSYSERYSHDFIQLRFEGWQAAERDTRERIILEIKEMSKRWRGTAEDTAHFIIERIRGVNR